MAQPVAVPNAPSKPTRKPSTSRYNQLSVQPLTDLSLPFLVRAVLQEHDLGQFQRSALLWEQIRRDDRCKAVLSVRINALIGLDVAFHPPEDQDNDAARKVAADAKTVWRKFATQAQRAQIVNWGLGLGFAFGRLNWETSKDAWLPRVDVWHPSFVSWRQDEMAFYVNTADGQECITPGENGWWIYAPFGYQRGWAEGYVHALSMPWLARSWAYRDWCRYNEIHGLPMIKAKIPQSAEDADESRFASELADRASSPVIRLPKGTEAETEGYDFELVEAKADTWEAFQGMKADANVDIAVSVLGQNLSTEVKEGSYAASKVQDKVRGDILDADARSLEEFFHDQVIAPWALYNVAHDDMVPEARFTVEEVADLVSLGDGLTKLGAGIVAMKNSGVQLDVDELTKRADVPTTGPAEEPTPPPAPVIAAPGAVPGAAKPAPFGKVKQLVASEGSLPTAENTQQEGQAYADAIVATHTEKGARAMDADRLKLLGLVLQADSLENLKGLVEKAYSEMKPDALASVMKLALLEAELDGWYSARGV